MSIEMRVYEINMINMKMYESLYKYKLDMKVDILKSDLLK